MNLQTIWHRGIKLRTNRWTRWAKSLSDRYGRVAVRRQGPTMLLIQSNEPEQRWIGASWTINPHIHLSIHPVLRETAGTGAVPHRNRFPGTEGSFQSILTKPASFIYVPSGRFSMASVSLEREPEHVLRHETSHHTHEVPQDHGFSLMTSAASYSWIQTQHAQQVLPRLIQEWKRIEQHSYYPPATMHPIGPVVGSAEPKEQARRRQQNRMTEAPSLATAEVFEAPQGWRINEPGMSRSKMPPEVDLERLTEQVVRKIDERIVAHRERLGRNF